MAVAAFGFFFDAYELLTLPLILGPALLEMGVPRESAEFNLWAGLMFWLPAVCGGLMGLAGGYLADRFGRRRVLVWSILVYAIASSASAFSTTPLMLLICRCLILVGVCVEFVAGVAWLAEMFTDPRRREANLGFSQAIAGFGGLAVTGIYILAVKHGDALPAILGAHAPWRYTCLSGLLPALPLLLVRPFLPESPMWKAGQMRPRPPVAALFQGSMRRTTWAAIAATACTYALAYGAMQHLPRVAVALPEVSGLSATLKQETAGNMQLFQETGGLVGRLLLATLVVAVVARRRLLTIAQVAALIAFPLTFAWLSTREPHDLRSRRLHYGGHHRRAVQFLGQLSAARVSHGPAEHWRKLCRQCRRANPWHHCRAGYDHADDAVDSRVWRRTGAGALGCNGSHAGLRDRSRRQSLHHRARVGTSAALVGAAEATP